MDRAKESSRRGYSGHGQQRVHRRIGGAVALRARFDRGVRVPFFSRARGARIAPVGRELLASARVRVPLARASCTDICMDAKLFSSAEANGHAAFAPAHNTIRTACIGAILLDIGRLLGEGRG